MKPSSGRDNLSDQANAPTGKAAQQHAKKQRLAKALKDNLGRRKAQEAVTDDDAQSSGPSRQNRIIAPTSSDFGEI